MTRSNRKLGSKSDREHHYNYVKYRSCTRKMRYKDEHEAFRVKKHLESLNPNTKLAVYYCELCKGFHLCKEENKFEWG